MPNKKKPKVLLIGWDAADWKVIHPLMDAGKMPALEKLINNGVSGNIASLEPVLSPMLWSSIATGKLADKHGIHGFTEPDPSTGHIRPVSGASRKAKAIWNILSHQDFNSNVIAWWPSHPAEPIKGLCVSNLYQRASADIDKVWPMLKGCVHPSELREQFKKLRIHPGELTAAHVLPFIPLLEKIDQEKDKRLESFLKVLADTATIQSAVTWSMENREWDFTAVYFDGIDHFSHAFMKYHPPRLPIIPKEDFEIYKDVVNSAYIFHDMMLERLVELAGEACHIILLSDHGFQSDHLRPLKLPKEPAAPAYEHRPYGIFCMSGPGIKKDELIHGASLLDVTPTLLQIFDLPIGEDMDGKVLVQAFEKEVEVKKIPSWEDVPGEFGMHKNNDVEASDINSETLQQLVDLGYIDQPDEDSEKAVKTSLREANINLAKVYVSTSRFKKAIEIYEKLNEEKEERRIQFYLLQCYKNIGKQQQALQLIEKLRKEDAEANKAQLLLSEAEIHISLNQGQKALNILLDAEKLLKNNVSLSLNTARAYLLLRKYKKAELHFKQCLKLDPDRASAHHGIGICLLRQKKYEEAAESLLQAVGLTFNFPIAHYHLGESLMALKLYQEAANAFELCLQQNPNIGKARTKLIEIYESGKAQRITVNSQLLNENVEQKWSESDIAVQQLRKEQRERSLGTVYIVSGLPRSGTSMCMQILVNGGLEALTDSEREADLNNPKGYFEFEKVKSLRKNKKWLIKARNKVVKVVAPLLHYLPDNYQYKVVFMQRGMEQVLLSQHKMLVSLGKAKTGNFHTSVEKSFENELKRSNKFLEKDNVEYIKVNYEEVLSEAGKQVERINAFFDNQLDVEKMLQAIDPLLYRNKNSNEKLA